MQYACAVITSRLLYSILYCWSGSPAKTGCDGGREGNQERGDGEGRIVGAVGWWMEEAHDITITFPFIIHDND